MTCTTISLSLWLTTVCLSLCLTTVCLSLCLTTVCLSSCLITVCLPFSCLKSTLPPLPDFKVWTCFSPVRVLALASDFEKNPLQTLLPLLLCCHYQRSTVFCWPLKCLCALSSRAFFFWWQDFQTSDVQNLILRTKTFSFQGPCTWNKLPHSVRHSSASSTFRSLLKSQLFKQ